MQVFEDAGICLRGRSRLHIDANGIKHANAIVTHAHSDHARICGGNTYLMTHETADLVKSPKHKKIPKTAKIITRKFGRKTTLSGFDISLHPSGHILGSAQVLARSGAATAAVTSDFNLQQSILFPPAEILHADVLVVESTFGLPRYKFPEREDVYEDIIRWVNHATSQKRRHFVVLGGYSTGKSQELTKILNEFCGISPVVHPRIFEQNDVYQKHGAKLGQYTSLGEGLNGSDVLIMPPHLISDDLIHALSMQLNRRVETAIATGWSGRRHKTFPLSDHADFEQLLHYVRESEPKLVLTQHGFAREFANSVQRKLGIPARPLEDAGQRTLAEFGF
ncbi:MAG: hypothetical protein ABH854_00130 [Candidatus Diapherotrites archaeon]|nr:MBL fold metallo-hydrolase [Candidatus Micrarchaeota archaeon]MBU1939924.1 MBL fold metallo-hydrolase [Candidatus Micrarchaeota archaeon]